MQKVGKENYVMGILLIAEKNAKSGEVKLCDGNNADSREKCKKWRRKIMSSEIPIFSSKCHKCLGSVEQTYIERRQQKAYFPVSQVFFWKESLEESYHDNIINFPIFSCPEQLIR